MKIATKITALAATALLAFTLSACGDDTASSSGENSSAQPRSQSIESETPEPLTAETPTSDPDDVDAQFVEYVRSELALLPSTSIANATAEQLITAGHSACEQLLAGKDSESIRLIEGEQPAASGYYMDSGTIIDGARRFYCPETIF
ncbi:DUF732 domain-containing protein [Microbacterium algeriense]|uniref:DUF732 domain-containing protein n=1 Tax=Microbacterium algeriense TaxID=2615184 RepID=UPI003D732EA9